MSDILKIDQWRKPTALPAPPSRDQIHLWKIDLLCPGLDLSPLLSGDERRRQAKLLNRHDRILFGNARGVLRQILSGYTNTPPADIPLCYGEKGKPRLPSSCGEIQFNLSHAGSMALLVVSTGVPVGIDLEPLAQRKNLRRIARKVFAPELFQQIDSLSEADFNGAFYRHWTALEAQVKAVGTGVFTPTETSGTLPYINFEPQSGWCAAIAADGTLPAARNWVTLQFSPDLGPRIG
ncbi:4'-phosphopantetheinyl transferase family protein [Sedimenticola thiotaurini]|uniref:4'-phosphopantetheinyl transferase family protein n=1 Tax=Sedimenticola thiotaurini TaxID=1543721 RepID=UPI00069BCC8D|nr:4'-phosphopantetheinyl transferase superfamily protein [Sedimenticola thiotaurini]